MTGAGAVFAMQHVGRALTAPVGFGVHQIGLASRFNETPLGDAISSKGQCHHYAICRCACPVIVIAKYRAFGHNHLKLRKYPGGGSRLREQTRETVESVIRHLKTGKSPKEVAATLGLTWACVQQITSRHREVRCVYIETYSLRHPQQSNPPRKILNPLERLQKTAQL